jgi:hypothetical protein
MRLENSRWSVIAFDSEGKGWRPSINTKRTETPAAFADLDPYPLSYPANSKQMVQFNYSFASRYGDWLTYIVNLDQSGSLYGSFSAPLILDQMGSETNWAAINADENSLRALKKDGTLWKLRTEGSARLSAPEPKDLPWDKISRRHDWLALSAPSDVITLAADGTLWWWESEGYPFGPDRYRVLRPSRKPIYLGSIFDQNQAAN